jgi:hypothetical protein
MRVFAMVHSRCARRFARDGDRVRVEEFGEE